MTGSVFDELPVDGSRALQGSALPIVVTESRLQGVWQQQQNIWTEMQLANSASRSDYAGNSEYGGGGNRTRMVC